MLPQTHDARPAHIIPKPVVVAMAVRLQTRGLPPEAIVGASMRKLVHLIYGVIKSGIPFNAEIAMNGLDLQEGI